MQRSYLILLFFQTWSKFTFFLCWPDAQCEFIWFYCTFFFRSDARLFTIHVTFKVVYNLQQFDLHTICIRKQYWCPIHRYHRSGYCFFCRFPEVFYTRVRVRIIMVFAQICLFIDPNLDSSVERYFEEFLAVLVLHRLTLLWRPIAEPN